MTTEWLTVPQPLPEMCPCRVCEDRTSHPSPETKCSNAMLPCVLARMEFTSSCPGATYSTAILYICRLQEGGEDRAARMVIHSILVQCVVGRTHTPSIKCVG